ncbi:hypothetical protein HK105_203771 [Polyrhizophydium stewartii]|uniref:Ankyrin repeat protein n=1 Tax=Polyrhizophydium stewartii TaxID=2732419 RepID=A0ABR4NAT8_9FUNG
MPRRSHWDRMPAELRSRIVGLSGPFTQWLLAGDRPGPVRQRHEGNPATLRPLWRDMFEADWPGDVGQLPRTSLTAADLSAVRSRGMADRLAQLLPAAERPLLVHAAMRNVWLDRLEAVVPQGDQEEGHNLLTWAHGQALWVHTSPESYRQGRIPGPLSEHPVWFARVAIDFGHARLLDHILTAGMTTVDELEASVTHHKVYYYGREISVAASAAYGGYLDVLQVLTQHGLSKWPGGNVRVAIESGNMALFNFVCERTPKPWHADLLVVAASTGNTEIIEYLLDECKLTVSLPAIVTAAKSRRTQAVLLLAARFGGVRKGDPSSSQNWNLINQLFKDGHQDVLIWLIETHCVRMLPSSIGRFAKLGNFEIVEASLKATAKQPSFERYGRTVTLCVDAAFQGAVAGNRFGLVAHLIESGFQPSNASIMDDAAARGLLPIVRYLHVKTNAECTTDAMDKAAANGHLPVVVFLHENRAEGCTTEAMDQAATNGHLDTVMFLHVNRTEGCTTAAMDGAAGNGHVRVLEFLHNSRSEGCTPAALNWAAFAGHEAAARFLVEHRLEDIDIAQAVEMCTCMPGDDINDELVQWLESLL